MMILGLDSLCVGIGLRKRDLWVGPDPWAPMEIDTPKDRGMGRHSAGTKGLVKYLRTSIFYRPPILFYLLLLVGNKCQFPNGAVMNPTQNH